MLRKWIREALNYIEERKIQKERDKRFMRIMLVSKSIMRGL